MSYIRGTNSPQIVFAKLGTDGAVNVWLSTPGHVVIDVTGYLTETSGLYFGMMQPYRLFDTRISKSGFAPMQFKSFPVANTQTVTYNKVRAVIGNAAAIAQANEGYLSVKKSPCNKGRNTFNVGFGKSELVLRGVVAAIGSDKAFCIRSSVQTHGILDAYAYLSAASMYRAVLTNPVRLLSHAGDGLINRRGLVKKGEKFEFDLI
jgi:hypothetical protein